MSDPTPNAIAVFDWLALLYSDVEEGWLSMFALDRTKSARFVDWHEVYDLDGASDRAAQRAETCDVWLGVATRSQRLAPGQGRGGDELCQAFPGLWLDVDIDGDGHKGDHALPPDEESALRLIGTFPLRPSAIVRSGGGLQAWWLFDEPYLAEDVAPVLPRWHATWVAAGAAFGWHVDNVFDLARIMRIPGTVNRKLDGGRPVALIPDSLTGDTYGLRDLDELLQDPPAPPQPAAPPREAYTGPERPGDVFNREHTPQEILGQHGWTLGDTDPNGDQQWVRPGKTAREGTSATVYAADGHTTIWSDTVPQMWPTMETRRPYDAFGLWVHMSHRGDWTKASDELAARGVGTKPKRDDLSWLPPPTSPPEAAPPPETDDDPEATPGSSWRPTGVAAIMDGGIERPTPDVGLFASGDVALYYSGRVNGLYGESGLGKSWIAVALADEVLRRPRGGRVAWIDIEEPAEGILQRLVDLGTPEDAIRDGFVHFSPEEPINLAAAMFTALDPNPPDLVVIDSTGEALTLEGFGPNNDDEVAVWFRTWARRMAHRWGACVVVIDHVVKDESTRGLFPGGSQRKRAAITGSAFMVSDIGEGTALNKGVQGRLRLTCAKDRHGTHRRGMVAGEFTLDGTSAPQVWGITPPGRQPTEEDRLAATMVQVCRLIAQRAEGADNGGPRRTNYTNLQDGVGGKKANLKKAVDWLTEHGYVAVDTIGQAHYYTVVRPYRGPDDTPSELNVTTCNAP